MSSDQDTSGTTTRTDAGASAPRREPLLTPAFVLLGLAELAYFTAQGVAVYALPFYVTGPVGSTAAGAGVAFGAYALSALALRPLAGRWSDTRGRLPLLVVGALLAAASLALTPVATTLGTVIGLRLLLGAGEAFFFVAGLAALADLAPPSRMGEAVSYNSLGLYLGLALGAPLGELLVRAAGFTGAWTGAAALAAAAAALVVVMGETGTADHDDRPSGGLVHRPALAPALGFLASVVAMGGFLAFASLHAGSVGMTNASLPILVYGLVVVVLRITLARMQDQLPPLLVGASALLLMSAGLLVIVVWAAPAGLVTGAAVTGAGVALSTPAFFAAIFATAGPASRGAAAATASLCLDLGIGIGPVLLGRAVALGGLPAAFLAGAGVAALGSVWTASLLRGRHARAVDERA